MNYINIIKVANGYIAKEETSAEMASPMKDQYVFETFDSLVKWLKSNFENKLISKGSELK